MIWPLVREWVPFPRTASSTAHSKNTKTGRGENNTRQRRHLQKRSRDISDTSLNRMGSVTKINCSRPSWNTSLDSLEEDMYDIEMGMKPTDSGTSDVGLGITSNLHRQDGDNEERVLGTLGVQRTVMETQQLGGILVERTIIVQEEMMRRISASEMLGEKQGSDGPDVEDDGRTRLYDWDRRDAPSRASFDTEAKA